ncbi:unnamed protein product [Tenebrio molitor]|nr:unnamed protein product [Tenebrio molitor]
MEEFEAWRTQEGREVDYAYTTSVNRPNGEKSIGENSQILTVSNKKSNCTKRAMKTGGSIRIWGICPSRICAKISGNVNF